MNCKKLDNILNVGLWIIGIGCIIGSWFLAEAITAPHYELANSSYHEKYQYEKEDGERAVSFYDLAWEHKSVFTKPLPVIYDSERDIAFRIKEEYIEQYRAMMSPSKYSGFWHRMFWVWFIVFSVICCYVIITYGPVLRDRILYLWLKHNAAPDFVDLTYFLYHDRNEAVADKVRKMVPEAASRHIEAHKLEMMMNYSPTFYGIINRWMDIIRATGSTSIPFYYTFNNQLKPQGEYLDELERYWESQRGIDSAADGMIKIIKNLKMKDYVTIPKIVCTDAIRESVVGQLKKLFSDILGNPIFNFYIRSDFDRVFRQNRRYISVNTTLLNAGNNGFTTKAISYSAMTFPGIRIIFTVDYVVNGNVTTLWRKELPPKCEYCAPEDEFNERDLYNRMVINTIDTFVETMKIS
ncbi:MAG: hypothetical protein K1V84_11165 [Muribaculaceae bacterium]